MIDTHCHPNHPDFDRDLPDVLRRAKSAGVTHLVCVGYDYESSVKAVDLARNFEIISAVVGVHPHDASTFSPEMEARVEELASDREYVVGLGEAGLDYYRDLSPRDVQQEVFHRHIELARKLDLPLVVHSRDAHEDVISILKEHQLPPAVVMHCVQANREFAVRALELGCYLGIAGPITFKNARELHEMARDLPLDSLLIETDAPYLTPHPHRGKRNEPSYLPLVANGLAEVIGVKTSEVAAATSSNAQRVFRLRGSS